MKLKDFKLERYFSKYEFNSPHLLCCSDCESLTVRELLELDGEGAYESFQNLWLGYTESSGSPLLRQQIASLYHNTGEGDILVTSGAEEAIFIFMNAALDNSHHIIVQHPCYQSLFEVARAIGCQITLWPAKEEDGWDLDIQWLKKNIRENTRAIIINTPHNPTGYLMPREKLYAIIELARNRNILLFSDEVYRCLEYRRQDRLEAACDIYPNAVSLGVMSKTYGLPGLRIGWAATKNKDLYKKMASFKDYTTICNSAPSEFLATVGLKHREELARRSLTIISENLKLLDLFFDRHSNLFSWVRPKAGPIAFPRILWGEDADDFCHKLVTSAGVLLLPGSSYDFDKKHFRIGFGRKNMPQCLEILDSYISSR